MRLPRRYAKPIGAGLILAGLLFLVYLFTFTAPRLRWVGHDAYAYWNVSLPEPYAIPWLEFGSFAYAPPMAYLMDVFGSVEWWVFSFLWLLLLIGSVIWIGGTPLWILAAFAFPPVALELYGGNIHILLAAAVVLGFSHPWTWSFVLLTKPTLGVGLLWFVVRREWRQLGIALGFTGALCAATLVLAPGLWAEWFEMLTAGLGREYARNEVPVPLWLRLILAVAVVVWGARTDRRWTVVVACTLAMPALWFGSFAMLIGVIPLIHEDSLFTRYRHVIGWRARTWRGRGVGDHLDPAVLP